MKNEKTIKAIKGFDDQLKCRGFQYEIGADYSLKDGEKVTICENGFHAIREDVSPLNVFDFYPPSIEGRKSRYCNVEISGATEMKNEKIAGSKIKIGAEIGIIGLIKAHFEWVKSRITNENNAEPGKAATAGDKGAATAGDKGAATSRGSVSVGKNGIGCVRGNGVKARGGLGAVLMVAIENENDHDIKEWKAFVVDGKTIKENTWYTLKDGNLVETE